MYVCMWRKPIKPVKRTEKKGKIRAGTATQAEMRSQCSGASGTLRERSVQGVSKAPVVGTNESVDLEEVTIEELTGRRRMTVEERRELPFSCTHCGRHFSRPRYMQRHKRVATHKKG